MASPTKILLVEDHTLFRSGMRSLLEGADHLTIVGEAADGREALKLAKKLKPDIVVMDVAMPNLNGIEATRQIRAALPNTRVIMLSMHGNREYIFESLRAGASGYLLKDAAFDELVQAIQEVRAGRTFLNSSIAEIIKEDYVERARGETPADLLHLLSAREREVLQLVAEGLSSSEIGQRLHLSVHTIDTHRRHIMDKLKIDNLAALIKFAIRHGLTTLE